MLDEELRELYQEVILDHQRDPRNYGLLEQATCTAEGFNPLCGDRIELYLQMDGDRIRQAKFRGAGCAISTASASLMTDALAGKTRKEAEAMSREFRALVTGRSDGSDVHQSPSSKFAKLRVFEGVQKFPMRVKCAMLAWRTLQAALNESQDVVSTE